MGDGKGGGVGRVHNCNFVSEWKSSMKLKVIQLRLIKLLARFNTLLPVRQSPLQMVPLQRI